MDRLTEIAAATQLLVQERFGQSFVREVRVDDYIDESGEDAYRVLVVVDEFDPAILTAENRASVAVRLLRELSRRGDPRFAFVTFVPAKELVDMDADD